MNCKVCSKPLKMYPVMLGYNGEYLCSGCLFWAMKHDTFRTSAELDPLYRIMGGR